MQILVIEDGCNYSVKHNGNYYMRYTDFDDVPYYISNNQNGHDISHEELEIELQKELKRIERLNKLNRIVDEDL